MAPPRQRNLVDRLQEAGEEAMQRLGGAPGADRVLGALNTVRDRVDELNKRVRGLEQLEKRLHAVERRLDALEGKKGTSPKTTTRSTTSRKKTS
jgi:hypothetical protein